MVANGASNGVAWETAANWSHSSPNHIELIFDDDQAQDDWFITPPLQLTAGKLYRVQFYYSADWIKDANSPASMEVRWAAQPTVAAMSGGQQIWDSPAFNWFQYRLGAGTVFPDQDGLYYIAWHGYSQKNQAGIIVDDITITEIDPAVSVFPYTENFDGVTAPALPQGWRVANGAANDVAWTNTDSTLAPSQPNAMKIALDSANAQDDWVISLPLALKAGAHYQVEFYYYISGANTDKLEVKWATAPTVAAMSAGQRIWSNAGLTGEDTGTTTEFSPATDGVYYIGWHSSSPAGQVFIYVDNIAITETRPLAVDLVTLGARPAAPVINPWIAGGAGALLAAALGRMVVSQPRCR